MLAFYISSWNLGVTVNKLFENDLINHTEFLFSGHFLNFCYFNNFQLINRAKPSLGLQETYSHIQLKCCLIKCFLFQSLTAHIGLKLWKYINTVAADIGLL